LRAADFVVRLDGLVQPIRVVTTNEPLRVVVLVDVTASLHNCVDGIAGAPSSALPNLGPTLATTRAGGLIPPAVEPIELRGLAASDLVRVGSIGRHPAIGDSVPGTSSELRTAWRGLFDLPPIEWLGPSPIWDAVADAAGHLRADPDGQRAIVLLTDGHATGNHRSHLDAVDAATAAGVSVNVIVEQTVWPAASREALADLPDPARALKAVADLTGGIVGVDRASGLDARRCFTRQPAAALEHVIGRLRHAYAIRLSALPDGASIAALDARVGRLDAVVRAPQRFQR
jgi:hypothetical protein